MTATRIERMRTQIEASLAPQRIEIRDDSALHAGHAGASGGAGHYAVRIVASSFAGLPVLKRHRLVYQSLASMMPQEIHALSIDSRARRESPDTPTQTMERSMTKARWIPVAVAAAMFATTGCAKETDKAAAAPEAAPPRSRACSPALSRDSPAPT